MTDATLTPAAGVGTAAIVDRAILGIPRSLYLYENVGLQAIAVLSRSEYLYENVGLQAISILARSLYLYENLAIQALAVIARALYLYETERDGEVFPWLMRINPTEQYRGGTIDLYGDGFGELLEAAAGATITTSSVSGGNVGGGAVDRSTGEWISTSGGAAWIRFTFGAPKTIVGIALSSLVAGVAWGVPEFRFSDGGPNINGGASVPAGIVDAEIPVGSARAYYALPAPRTTTYVEIRTASGAGGTNTGLSEVWIYEDLDQAAEASSVISNDGEVSEVGLGIVTWRNRSPGLWPANGGLPITPAATATIPPTAESGLVIVEEDV